jgi:hypothetical protein
MKPLPAPNVPGNTEAEKFDNAVRRMFSVSKEEMLKREAKWKREQARKKRAKNADLSMKSICCGNRRQVIRCGGFLA